MPYVRPTLAKPAKPHPLETNFGAYRQIKSKDDPAWIIPHLLDLHDVADFYLSRFRKTVAAAMDMDLSEYKPEVAKAKRSEKILDERRALMKALQGYIEKARASAQASTAAILRATAPDIPADSLKALRLEVRQAEIRNLIRAMEPEKRKEFVQGNLERIQALISSPDEILPEATMTEIRRAFVLSKDPTIADEERDSRLIYEAVRRRAAEVSATAVRILQEAEIEDPLTKKEFFETFPQESGQAAYHAEKMVKEEQSRADQETRRTLWEKEHAPGLAFGE